VHIVQDPPQEWTGYGIYLGKGLILTAAHVVGSAAKTKPSVHIAGLALPARAVKEGSLDCADVRSHHVFQPDVCPWHGNIVTRLSTADRSRRTCGCS
jgi:hypothetical protein